MLGPAGNPAALWASPGSSHCTEKEPGGKLSLCFRSPWCLHGGHACICGGLGPAWQMLTGQDTDDADLVEKIGRRLWSKSLTDPRKLLLYT